MWQNTQKMSDFTGPKVGQQGFCFIKRTRDMKTPLLEFSCSAVVLMFMHVSITLNKSYKNNFCV